MTGGGETNLGQAKWEVSVVTPFDHQMAHVLSVNAKRHDDRTRVKDRAINVSRANLHRDEACTPYDHLPALNGPRDAISGRFDHVFGDRLNGAMSLRCRHDGPAIGCFDA